MIAKFHYITQDIEGFTHAQLAELACKGGADWVQLRVKKKSLDEWLKIAEETKSVCRKHNAKLIINDNVFLAKEVAADGVHLGQQDMSPVEARKILGENFIIGGTANTMGDVELQIANGCVYIGLGPYRFTTTKENLNSILGLEKIKIIAEKYGDKIPIIAVGGIKLENVEALMHIGVHGIAVSSAINFAENKIEMTKKFCCKLH